MECAEDSTERGGREGGEVEDGESKRASERKEGGRGQEGAGDTGRHRIKFFPPPQTYKSWGPVLSLAGALGCLRAGWAGLGWKKRTLASRVLRGS